MTSSNGNIFRVTGHLCGEFPAKRPVTRSFDVFFDLRLNKQLSKQSWGWWFEMLLHPLWRHCNVISVIIWNNDSNSSLVNADSLGLWAPSQYPKRRLFVRSRKVSKPREWYFKLSYRFEIWQAHLQHCCRSACQISERSDNSEYKSRGFETLRDLTERRLFGYWEGTLVLILLYLRLRSYWRIAWPVRDTFRWCQSVLTDRLHPGHRCGWQNVNLIFKFHGFQTTLQLEKQFTRNWHSLRCLHGVWSLRQAK